MRYFVALIVWLAAGCAMAQEWEHQETFSGTDASVSLRIISSTDADLFAPVIETFIAANPNIAVEYFVTGTAELNERFRADPGAFDIAVSSAMDLQLKLVNDGFAKPLPDIPHVAWAQWRQSLFAFTSEPAAIVINRQAFEGQPIPQTRQQLIEALRARPETFRNRVGTYDVRQSGLGYLFATQDARASETFWRLMEVMGSLDVRLYCCSGTMIDDLTDGTIAVAYNVLGSYAAARTESETILEIILPSDFPTTMMRTAFVSGQTTQSQAAERFIRHLIAFQSGQGDGRRVLPALKTPQAVTDRATIALQPALMTFLDVLKRRKFLAEWEDAMIQD
jgi:iron(III) transport system substrate-binding protein